VGVKEGKALKVRIGPAHIVCESDYGNRHNGAMPFKLLLNFVKPAVTEHPNDPINRRHQYVTQAENQRLTGQQNS